MSHARRISLRSAALAALLALAAGCASAPRPVIAPAVAATLDGRAVAATPAPGRAARAGLEALLRGDLGKAEARFAAAARDGDAWGHLGRALLARRTLAEADERVALVAVVTRAPGSALAPIALRRLEALAEAGGDRAQAVEDGLAPLAAPGRLAGLAAYRARVARIRAAEKRGDLALLARLRDENGSVDHWSLAGPFSPYHALDFDRPFPPEQGAWPAQVPAPAELPARETRPLDTPDGTLALDGEGPDDDVYYLATDATLARGGDYLVSLGASGSARLFVDGAPVLERRRFAGHPSMVAQAELALAPGAHRLLVKVARGQTRGLLHVALARMDGTPSDASFRAAVPGAPPPAAPAPGKPVPVAGAEAAAGALDALAGPPAGAIVAALDVLSGDREAAKRLLDAAVARAPKAALPLALRAAALREDPTLDPQIARSRAEADLRAALARDGGDAAVRLDLAGLLAASDRLDDAEALLAGLPAAAARRPAALLARARLAAARGFDELAAKEAEEALAAGAGCDALAFALDLAEKRDAVARRDEAARGLARCPDGRERLAAHLAARGRPREALEVLAPVAAARPWAVDLAFARANAELAAGAPAAAAAILSAERAIWPRSTRVAKRLADALELSGDPAAARRERERALLLDGSDLALRRALALEDGPEVLDAQAEDARAAIRAYEKTAPPRDASSAMVLDAAAIALHPGGAATERVHQVIQVLDPSGVDENGEVEIPADADVVSLRTIKRDGRVVEPEAGAGAGEKGAVSLAGLEPGDYVDFEYLRGVGGNADGYAADPFYFQVAGTSLFRSSYVVTAPRGLGLAVDAKNMEAPAVKVEDDREVVRALRTRVPALIPEPGAPPMQEFLPFLHVGTGAGREAMVRALADALAERTRPTVEVEALARAVRAEAGPDAAPERLVRAAYAAVAARVLGQEGSLADDASVVLSRGRGGRLVVLAAVLRALGTEPRLVLVRPFGADPRPYRFPSPAQWSELVLRVRAGGETFWLDPRLRGAPFGALPPETLDCDALVLPAPGEPIEETHTPARAEVEDRRILDVDVALAEDGSAEVKTIDRYEGQSAGAARAALEQLDPSERTRSLEAMLARSFRGLAISSVAVEGEDDPEAPLLVRWTGKVPQLARAATDGAAVLDAAILPARLAGRFVRVAARTTPLLVEKDEHLVQRIRIAPPPGFAARAQPKVAVDGALGAFGRTERVEAGRLVREERLDLRRGRYAPDRYADVAAFAASVDEAQERPTVFTRAP